MVHIKTFHLFAGAGGGILGDLLLGHEPIGAVEIEKYPREVLLARQRDGILPLFPIWDDVTTFRSDNPETSAFIERLKAEENLCICGGFPCQDISVAQWKGAEGIQGERSGMWSEMARIINEVRPKFTFVENSPMLVGRGLGCVLADLSEMGYNANWCVLGAGHIGASHLRERIWVLASNSKLFRPTRHKLQEVQGIEALQRRQANGSIQDLNRRCSIFKPKLLRDCNGVPYQMDRLKSTGNAQFPQVVKLAWEILGG